jgi:hypothetical protein
MKKIAISFVLLLCLGGIVFVRDSEAAFYKYVNKDGVVCFADNLQVIPEQYRAKAVIVEGEAKNDGLKPAGPAAGKPEAAPSAAEAKPGGGDQRPLSTRLMISGAVVVCALMFFLIISNLAEFKDDKKILSVIRGSLVGVVSVYIVFAHAKDVTTIFGAAGQAVQKAQHQSEEKGKKAARAVKSLDALFDEAQKAQKTQEASTVEPEDDNNK